VARWPDPVTNLTVTGGNNSVTAHWTPPANNGGLAVDHYYVLLYPESSNWCYANTVPNARLDVTGTHVTFDAATIGADTADGYLGTPVNGTYYTVTVFPENGTVDGYTNGNDDCYPIAGSGQDVSASALVDPVSAAQGGQPGQYTPIPPVSLLGSGGIASTK
jgi:hypothetical protein